MPILADADSFKKCRYLPIPMPINRHITSSGDRLPCSREAVLEGACGFCLMLLIDSFIRCLGCGGKFHLETLCMGVEENVIFVLLEDKVGAVL